MRSILRSAVLAGSVLSLSFALVGCDDASKTTTTTPADTKTGASSEPQKNSMEPTAPAKDGMAPAEPKGAMEPPK